MIRFRTTATGHRVAVVWSGPESSRLGRLTMLQAAGIELSALSEADALGEAPKRDTWTCPGCGTDTRETGILTTHPGLCALCRALLPCPSICRACNP